MKRFVISVVYIALLVFGVLMACVGIDSSNMAMAAVGGIVAAIFLTLFIRKRASEKKKHIAEVGTEANAEEIAAACASKAEKKQAKKDRRKAYWDQFHADSEIESVVIAGQETKTSASSAVARGAVGGAILGPVGILAAAGAKKNSSVTLIIHYRSGRAQTKKVKLDSREFKQLSKYIH